MVWCFQTHLISRLIFRGGIDRCVHFYLRLILVPNACALLIFWPCEKHYYYTFMGSLVRELRRMDLRRVQDEVTPFIPTIPGHGCRLSRLVLQLGYCGPGSGENQRRGKASKLDIFLITIELPAAATLTNKTSLLLFPSPTNCHEVRA